MAKLSTVLTIKETKKKTFFQVLLMNINYFCISQTKKAGGWHFKTKKYFNRMLKTSKVT